MRIGGAEESKERRLVHARGEERTMAAASDSLPKRMSMCSHACLKAAKNGGTWNRKGAEVFMQNTLLFSLACWATWRMESAECVRTNPAM